jgi:cell division protease FtsH
MNFFIIYTSLFFYCVNSLINPSSLIKTLRPQSMDTITYTELVSQVQNKMLEGASIVHDKTNDVYGIISFDPEHNFHKTQIFPSMIEHTILVFTQNKTPFDMYNLPNGINPLQLLFSPTTFILGYIGYMFISSQKSGKIGQMPQMGQMGKMNSMNNIQNTVIDNQTVSTRFIDVAGCDEAKRELIEVIDFLKNPDRYVKAGAKLPKGVLLEGLPGTGKTLLARAVAGEAGVPFISISGSEFVEVYVGLGAMRVRQLFENARKSSPCVVFIDEIDAIGKKRSSGSNQGNDEREQTLNQILTNMDGFKAENGIIVLAATNRIDVLDSALTRPGRFDRKVKVPLPNSMGRKEILKVHLKNKTITKKFDITEIADLTHGFSGADLANLANEATILSVRENSSCVEQTHFLKAYEKITIGLPYDNDTRPPEVIQIIARHEIGHALLVQKFNKFFDLRKVTIIQNQNGAGGYALFTSKEPYDMFPTKEFLLAKIIVSLGGRAAEVIFFKNKTEYNDIFNICFPQEKDLTVTTGASSDLKQAYYLAEAYVTQFGFSNTLISPPIENRGNLCKENINEKIEHIVRTCYITAITLLKEDYDSWVLLSNQLIQNKTLDASAFI